MVAWTLLFKGNVVGYDLYRLDCFVYMTVDVSGKVGGYVLSFRWQLQAKYAQDSARLMIGKRYHDGEIRKLYPTALHH